MKHERQHLSMAFQRFITQLGVFKNMKVKTVTLFEVWPNTASRLKLKNPNISNQRPENTQILVE